MPRAVTRRVTTSNKQFVRDWLEQVRIDGQPWNKRAPAPALPAEVVKATAARYQEALERLTRAG